MYSFFVRTHKILAGLQRVTKALQVHLRFTLSLLDEKGEKNLAGKCFQSLHQGIGKTVHALAQLHHQSVIDTMRRWLGSCQQAQTGFPRLADENLYKVACRLPVRPTGRLRNTQCSWGLLHLPIEDGIAVTFWHYLKPSKGKDPSYWILEHLTVTGCLLVHLHLCSHPCQRKACFQEGCQTRNNR